LVATCIGSKSSEPLKLSTASPSAASAFLIVVSRAITAGS